MTLKSQMLTRKGWSISVESAISRVEDKQGQAPPATVIVCQARWADATGDVGPWSRTLVARVEGEILVPGFNQGTVDCDDDPPQLQLAG